MDIYNYEQWLHIFAYTELIYNIQGLRITYTITWTIYNCILQNFSLTKSYFDFFLNPTTENNSQFLNPI